MGRVACWRMRAACQPLSCLGQVADRERAGCAVQVSIEDFANWYKTTSMFKDQVQQAQDGEDGEDEGASLDFPDDFMGRFWYIVLFPITVLLYFTVPDVRWKNGWEKWYMVRSSCTQGAATRRVDGKGGCAPRRV